MSTPRDRERDRIYSDNRYKLFNSACEKAILELGGECNVCGRYHVDVLSLMIPGEIDLLRLYSVKNEVNFTDNLRLHNAEVRCPQHLVRAKKHLPKRKTEEL